MNIARVLSTSFAMFRQRFWPLVGMWAVFFAIQIAGSVVLAIGMAVVGLAGAAGLGSGLENPSALAGLGIGMIVFLVLFYGAYIVLLLAQQAAMVTLASPLEEPAFGAALGRGFKAALPFFAIAVILLLGYFFIAGVIRGAAGMAGDADSGPAISVVTALLSLPVLVYLACRLAVLIPVVAVEQVFDPIAAIRRSWTMTRGKAGDVLLALLAFAAVSLVAMVAPFAVIFGGLFAAQDNESAAAGFAIVGVLLFIPLLILYTIYAAAFTAVLHSEVSGGGAESLEEVFA